MIKRKISNIFVQLKTDLVFVTTVSEDIGCEQMLQRGWRRCAAAARWRNTNGNRDRWPWKRPTSTMFTINCRTTSPTSATGPGPGCATSSSSSTPDLSSAMLVTSQFNSSWFSLAISLPITSSPLTNIGNKDDNLINSNSFGAYNMHNDHYNQYLIHNNHKNQYQMHNNQYQMHDSHNNQY